jgi:hypothetical protein
VIEGAALIADLIITSRSITANTIPFQRPAASKGPGIIKKNTWLPFARIAIKWDINTSKYLFLMFNSYNLTL